MKIRLIAAAVLLSLAAFAPDARAQSGARGYVVQGDCDGRPATQVRMAPG